ncbi:acyltransferase [Microbacterium esteraromaticum]|uniref:Acyltransferase n=1 Tax=Microbacterium esteraromaticum TaxID=57043 RepID=A0A939DUN4_9MICO|nr:acyltransferase [Microbacterium esteraromaticum]MBN8415473.1 acyltransferase [Microbacterium esteraromaticum]
MVGQTPELSERSRSDAPPERRRGLSSSHVCAQRGTNMKQPRIGGLDALRGLAALAVFICHAAAYWGGLGLPRLVSSATQVGAHGVDVFIVLSGFVLTLPLVARGRSLNVGQFYGRRMWRILPAYWTALAIAAVLALGPAWDLVVAERASVRDLLLHVFAIQTVFPSNLGAINGSLWSVSLEILLYLLFPLLIVLLHRVGGTVLVLAAIALSFSTWWVGSQLSSGNAVDAFFSSSHTLPIRLVQFVMGMVLAMVLMRPGSTALDPTHRNRTLAMLAAGATTLAAVAASTLDVPPGINLTLWGICGAALVWLFALFAQSPVVRTLDKAGTRSYSFYLMHQPIVLLMWPIIAVLPGNPVVVLLYGGVVALVIVSCAAEALYRLVERPSHRYAVRRFPHVVRRADEPVPHP